MTLAGMVDVSWRGWEEDKVCAPFVAFSGPHPGKPGWVDGWAGWLVWLLGSLGWFGRTGRLLHGGSFEV